MPKISILLPTRGRRKLAERFITEAILKASRPHLIQFILYVDNDDADSHGIHVDGAECHVIVGDRITMGGCNTCCLDVAEGEIIILGNDDVIIRTDGWDDAIRSIHNSVPDKIYLAYPNDLNKGKDLSAFPIISKHTCNLLSEPFPRLYKGAFIDTHLMEIFIRVSKLGNERIYFLEDVHFEHMHFRTGKSIVDKTYLDRDRFADDMIFLSLHTIRKESARFLSGLLKNKAVDRVSFEYIEPLIIKKPSSFLGMVWFSARLYLGDPDLPMRLRVVNFFYYVARWIASSVKLFR